MEYKRIDQDGEIVLSYSAACHAEEIRLRYERELPQGMREEVSEEADRTAELRELCVAVLEEQQKKKRKRKWVAVTSIVLSILLSLTGLGAGAWWISRMVTNHFVVQIEGQGSNQDSDRGDSQKNEDNDSGNDSGNRVPGWGNDGGTTIRNEGVPNIEVYRPSVNVPRFELIRVTESQKKLDSGEIYKKVAPSTVTVLGKYGSSYSVGTGVIFTSDGYIVTNYHVIAGCHGCEVWVTNAYGVDSTYAAKFVGGDEDKDLAVIKIEAEGLPAAEFGVSSDLSVGDKVYAIGNPLGTELRSTFTDGIVSAVDRTVDVDGVSMTLIQTNTALNSGNSGGPLINAYGQVVGINTIKMMSGEDTIEGLGFAIPSSLAERWINDILTLGEIRPSPVLGLSVNRIPVRLSDGTEGLQVLDVTKGLGAYRAGVRAEDVIVEFNGVTVHRVEDIYAERLKLSVGDEVIIRVYRDGEYLDLKMIMMAEPE